MKRWTVTALGLALAIFGLRGLAGAAPIELATTPTSTATATALIWPTVTVAAPQTLTVTATPTPTRRITATPTVTASVTLTATPTAPPDVTRTFTPTPTFTATPTVTGTPTPTPTITPTPTVTGTPTPTPIRYPLSLDPDVLSIDALRARPYGGSGVKITRVVFAGEAYKQVLIEYPSDGLRITGTMNIPRGAGPFPVVILDHGYFKPAEYKTGDGTSRAADAFARGGYLTLAPDYRCYAGSQCGSNPFYIGYAIDVLNLLAQLPTVPDADTTRIGLWGHSMGGGITLRVLAISDSIKVASLYGALTGDDQVHYCWLRGCPAPATPSASARVPARPSERLIEIDPDFAKTDAPPAVVATNGSPSGKLHDIFLKSSASQNLANVTAAVIIHHGEADDIVPIQWSVELADALSTLGKTAVLYTYPGEGHVFAGWGWQLFMTRTLAFFDDYLKPRESIVTVDRRVLRQERVAAESSY